MRTRRIASIGLTSIIFTLDGRTSARGRGTTITKKQQLRLQTGFALRCGNIMSQEYIIGKKMPLKDYKLALMLDFGLIWQNFRSYTGDLREMERNSYTIAFRPNLQF